MHRRSYLYGLVGTTSVALAGCTRGNSSNGGGQEETPTESTTATSTQNAEKVVLLNETIYTKSRYPEDLRAGQTLLITVEVKKGGPLILDIANIDTGESVFKEIVETEKTMEFTVKNNGTHYITFQGMDKAHIKVVLK